MLLATRKIDCCAFLVVLLLFARPLFGSEPHLYLLRTAPDWRQGIVRFDPETGSEARFADFIYSAYFGGADGGLQLTALADRIIAEGAAYYEFDASSGQLLRRYPALAAGYDNWAFHGVAVDTLPARKLGIPSGYYGSPICPPSGSADPPILCSVPAPFPRYSSHTNLTEQNVFLRRGLDPGDTTLSVAKIFSLDSAGGSPWVLRLAALDAARGQFWFWLQLGAGRLTLAPVANGNIGDEIVVRVDPAGRSALGFSYDSSRDVFFLPFLYGTGNLEQRLARQTIAGLEEILKRAPENGSFDSVTLPSSSDPELYTQLLPAVADTPGANGTYWRSDAWLFNPSDAPMDVMLRRVSRPAVVKRLTLIARASVKIANILRELGGGVSGDGAATDAVVIESPFRTHTQLSVYSRTYTASADGGTYGQAIPAVPALVGYSNHVAPTTAARSLADTLPAFILDKRDPQQYRHNIGIVNTSDDPLSIRLRFAIVSLLPVSDPDREKILTIPPHTLRQYTIEALFPREVIESLPPYIVVMGDRPAALWLSMVDNKSGDASFIPFTYYGVEAAPDARLAFPAVAHTRGANGTFWRTDGYGVFWVRATGGQPQAPEVNFYSAGAPCAAGTATQMLAPSPGLSGHDDWLQFWKTTFADVAHQVCPSSEQVSGALEVRTGSWMTMVSRTYTTREDGGTYGDILPLYPPRGWPTRHFAGIELSDGFRVNVGLYNGSDSPSRIVARLYDENGGVAAEKIIALEPRASRQSSLRQFFDADLQNGIYGLSFLTLEGAGCWPYVSTVDNITGDPTNWW
ncbi:MAG TPA: hypothetical protein VER58_18725 [Thermoanaerobaculia bacterium]|nr:hypothetical protein [Thermoanaerobaculia bacterium]